MKELPIYPVLLLLGSLQGIVLGGVLWFTDAKRKTSNRFLAALLFFLSYRLLAEVLWYYGFLNIESWLYHVVLEYNWIYGALLYFYVRSYLDARFSLQQKHLVHFLPVGIEFLISNFIKTQNFFWDGTRESLSWAGYWGYALWMQTPFQYVVSVGLLIFYIYLGTKLIHSFEASYKGNRIKTYLSWLRILLSVLLYFSIAVLILTITDFLFFNYAFEPFYVVPLFVAMAGITYWLGLQGFSRRRLPYPAQLTRGKDQPSGSDALTIRIKEVMEKEKLYLDPELTLNRLAKELNEQPYVITSLLNGTMGTTFSEYVNRYRVQESIRLIEDTSNNHLTITAIGLEAGFNSKASFNRIFKQLTGKTPGAFRKGKDSIS